MKPISKSELNELTGKTQRTVTSRLAELDPIKKTSNAEFYDSEKALTCIYLGEQSSMQKVRDRRTIAETEKAELELRQLKGEVVDIDDVCGEVEKEYVIVRQNLLSLPSKLAKPLSFANDPSDVQAQILKAITQILSELSYSKKAKSAAIKAKKKTEPAEKEKPKAPEKKNAKKIKKKARKSKKKNTDKTDKSKPS